MSTPQSLIAAMCALLIAVPPAAAQQSTVSIDEQDRWHSAFTKRYTPRDIAPTRFSNSSRLESLIRAGRIYLSLQDAIALALENNLDIELQRYGPRIAQADLLRAQSGGVVRGVPQGIQQGPQSAINLQTGGGGQQGGVGGGGGGNFSGAGVNNASVIFSGTQIPNLDEVAFVGYTWGHRTFPQANSLTTGIPALVFDRNDVSFGIQKGFLTGTTLNIGYAGTGQTSNNRVSEINPVTNANANVQVTQRLLQGFGLAVNSRNIRIARNDIRVSDLVFKQQVIATVSSVVNLYFDLVSLQEDVKVRRQALTLYQKLYNDNRKQVEIGTLAPIEIIRAEAEVARSEQELTQAETQLLQQETIIKNALSRTGISSPSVSDARIVPTDPLRIPDVEPVEPIQDLIERALANRPELEVTQLNIQNARISLDGSKSQLLPSLDLVATAQNNGLAGSVNQLPPPGGLNFTRNANPAFIGGTATVLNQIFSRNYPDYSIGFNLSIPIRNRTAQADYVRDALTLRQNEIRQRQQANAIRVDVQNAMIGLQQARARYQAAQKSRVLQEQTLDAEQKKYALGASTIFFVIQAQRDLAAAQAAEVSALSSYNRSRTALDSATGQVLDTYNIMMEEARTGKVARTPSALPEQP